MVQMADRIEQHTANTLGISPLNVVLRGAF